MTLYSKVNVDRILNEEESQELGFKESDTPDFEDLNPYDPPHSSYHQSKEQLFHFTRENKTSHISHHCSDNTSIIP